MGGVEYLLVQARQWQVGTELCERGRKHDRLRDCARVLSRERGDAYDTIMDGFTVSVEGIVGAEVIEFWPDLVRRHKRKHDEKMARRAAQTAGNR